jgi:hypothetical protein
MVLLAQCALSKLRRRDGSFAQAMKCACGGWPVFPLIRCALTWYSAWYPTDFHLRFTCIFRIAPRLHGCTRAQLHTLIKRCFLDIEDVTIPARDRRVERLLFNVRKEKPESNLNGFTI